MNDNEPRSSGATPDGLGDGSTRGASGDGGPGDFGWSQTAEDHDGTELGGGEPSGSGVDPSKDGCRYRIVSHHKTGGLGEIFLAEDLELGRTVALKEIRDRHALDAQARARFFLEAEVIGKLEHPGIVPIYGLGHYHDGRPYYAMRFIKGDSLREAIDRYYKDRPTRPTGENELMFRGLLGRLVDACNAIDYAHSRGVLHRDLKPGNIMLGRFGETLVVDWGLAKVLGFDGDFDAEPDADEDETVGPFRSHASEAVDPTRFHSAIGTPRYMSPEQAAGKVDELGPASDVFGLGATLYCLLTGRAPYLGPSREAVEELARRCEFHPPRKVRREVAPPLESICLKAMQSDPSRRYLSAKAMADDIERWLADEPVSAHFYSPMARAARWGRRHLTQVVAASVLLMAASIFSVVVVAKERVAAYNFKLAGDVNDKALGYLNDTGLLYVPQMNEVRSQLSDDAVHYSQLLLNQHPDDPDLRYEHAKKCFKAAGNHLLAGRMGRFLEYNDEILAIYRRLIDDFPKNLRYVNATAFTELARGSALHQSGDTTSALTLFRSALVRAERLNRDEPGSVHYRTTLARSRMYLGDALLTRGEYPEALGHYKSAIEQLDPLVEAQPHDHFLRRNLVQSLCGRGVVAAETGDGDRAGPMFDRANVQVDALKQRDYPQVEVDVLRAYVLRERGRWLASSPGPDCLNEAERAHDQAERLMKKHCDAYPDVRDYKVERACALLHRGLARSRLEASRKSAAEDDLVEALRLLEPLDGQGVRSIQGQAKGALGRLLLARGERERGGNLLREAVALQRGCLQANEASPIDKKALADHEGSLREVGLDPP